MIKIQFGKTPKKDMSSSYNGSSLTWSDIKKSEERLLTYYKELISSDSNDSLFTIEHRSQEYTTLFYMGAYWIARLKWTPNTKWVKLCCIEGDRHFTLCSEKDLYQHIDLSKDYIKYINDLEARRSKKNHV